MRDILNELEAAEMAEAPDPMVSAQKSMQANLPKRFYQKASVAELADGGFGVHLDGKPVRTPARDILRVSNEALGSLLAVEWEAQIDVIDPRIMPVTRLVNTALDGVANEASAVVEDLLRFASNDLLFYRSEHPQELTERQRLNWDPVLEKIEGRLGIGFKLAAGIIHVTQSAEALYALKTHVAPLNDPIEIACLHTITNLTGSALLALAHWQGDISGDEAWGLAHLDEDWNIEKWGEDDEAIRRRKTRKVDMDAAVIVLKAAKQ